MDAIEIVKKSYVKELLAKGRREDLRNTNDFRSIAIETGLIKNAEGSAHVDLGATRVLAGIKLDVTEPMQDTPNQGTMTVSAELLPLASSSYEGGPPSPEAIEFARVVDRGIRAGNCINLESMFIEEGKAWCAYIDLYVLNYNGNLFDAGELAAMAAILDAKVPKYEEGKVVREDRTKKLKVDNIVTSCTFAKIGDSRLLDPSGNEEAAADARMTIATDGENVRAMQKGLGGGFFANEIDELVGASFNKHDELKNILKKAQK